MRDKTQESQVIEALRKNGGFATFRRLNEIIDFSLWKTKTPEASVRRIVQTSKDIFRVQPGLWALEKMREEVLQKFELKPGDKKSEEQFSHGYFQGLLIEIGKFQHQTTYIPAQDRKRIFLDQRLETISTTTELPPFTCEKLLRKARTIDVIWFNEREMPSAFFEVEHTTDIKNSLSKFYELQDFFAQFFIVANENREKEFADKIDVSMFAPIAKRVKFLGYGSVVKNYEGLTKIHESKWKI